MVASRTRAASGVDSSRSGQGAEGNCGSAERGSRGHHRRQLGKHATHVFSFREKPITQVSTKAWYDALERGVSIISAGMTCGTWASWHVQQGTPLHVLQELGGWESAEMVRRYAHLTAEHLAPRGSPVRSAGSGRIGRWHNYGTGRNEKGVNQRKPLLTGAPGRIRTHDPLVRSLSAWRNSLPVAGHSTFLLCFVR